VSAKAKNEVAQEPEQPESPTRNRLIVKNATLESLTPILADQGMRGIIGLYDELTSFPTGAGQYKSGGNDIEEMLKLRDGGRHTVDRMGKFTKIHEYAMNIVGGTQPDRIRKVVTRMDLTNNGFLIQPFRIREPATPPPSPRTRLRGRGRVLSLRRIFPYLRLGSSHTKPHR